MLVLLALVAVATWLPVRDAIGDAAQKQFVSKLVSSDFQERIAARSNPNGGRLQTNEKDESLYWSASSRSVRIPAEIRNLYVSVRNARNGNWQPVDSFTYFGSGQSPTYRVDWTNTRGNRKSVVILGITGQTISDR